MAYYENNKSISANIIICITKLFASKNSEAFPQLRVSEREWSVPQPAPPHRGREYPLLSRPHFFIFAFNALLITFNSNAA